MTLVRSDAKGLYVRAGGYVARPGDVVGYSHAYNMSDGGLAAGGHVKARHIPCTPITKLITPTGTVLHWHHEQ